MDNTNQDNDENIRDSATAERKNEHHNSSIEERLVSISLGQPSGSCPVPLNIYPGTELVPVCRSEGSSNIIERMRDVCDGKSSDKTRPGKSCSDEEVIFSFHEVRRMKTVQYKKYKMGYSQNKFIDYDEIRNQFTKNRARERNSRNTFDNQEEEIGEISPEQPNAHKSFYHPGMENSKSATRENKRKRAQERKSDDVDIKNEDVSLRKKAKHEKAKHEDTNGTRHFTQSKNTMKKNETGYSKWQSKYHPRQPGRDADGEYIITRRGTRQSMEEYNRWTKFKERENIRKNIELSLREYKRTFENENETNVNRKVASYLQSLSRPIGDDDDDDNNDDDAEEGKQAARSSSPKGKNPKESSAVKPVLGPGDRECVAVSLIPSSFRDITMRSDRDKEVYLNTLLRSQPFISPLQTDLGSLLSANVIESLIRQHVANNFANLTEKLKEELSRQLLGNTSNQSTQQPAVTENASVSRECVGPELARSKRNRPNRSKSRENETPMYETSSNRSVSPESVDHSDYKATYRCKSNDMRGCVRGEPYRHRSSSREREKDFEQSYVHDGKNSSRQRSGSRDIDNGYIRSHRNEGRNFHRHRNIDRDKECDYVSLHRDDGRYSCRQRSPIIDMEGEYDSPDRVDCRESFDNITEPGYGDRDNFSSYRDDRRQSCHDIGRPRDEESHNATTYRDEARYAYQHDNKSMESDSAYEYSYRRHSRSPRSFEKDDYDYSDGRQAWDKGYQSSKYYSEKNASSEQCHERLSAENDLYDEYNRNYRERMSRSPGRNVSRKARYESDDELERHRSSSKGDEICDRETEHSKYNNRNYEDEELYRTPSDFFREDTSCSVRRVRTRSRSKDRDSNRYENGSSSLDREDRMLLKSRDDSVYHKRRLQHIYDQPDYERRPYSMTSTNKRSVRHHHTENGNKCHDDSAKQSDDFVHTHEEKRPRLDYSPGSDNKLSNSHIRSRDGHIGEVAPDETESRERAKSSSERKCDKYESITALSHKSSQSESSESSAGGGRKNGSQRHDCKKRSRTPPSKHISKDSVNVDQSGSYSYEFDAYQFSQKKRTSIPRNDPKKHRYFPPKASATVTKALPEHKPDSST